MPSLWADSLGEHRELVITRLLDAFAQLQREHGVDGVTLSAVAKRAGIARSAIYNYVQDKHALLFAHAERTISEFVDELATAAARGDDPADRLRRYVRGAMRAFVDEGAGQDLMPLLTAGEQARMMQLLRPVHAVVERIVRDGLAAGVFAVPSTVAARAGDPSADGGSGTGGEVAALVEFVTAALEGYRRSVTRLGHDPDVLADSVTDLLLYGLSGRS